MARNNACETWSSHAAAAEAVKAGQADGLGFALTDTDIAAIDLDRCRDPATGTIDAWAQAIIDQATAAFVRLQFPAQDFALSARAPARKPTRAIGLKKGRKALRSKFTAARSATSLFRAFR
jgi:hypothetical protein